MRSFVHRWQIGHRFAPPRFIAFLAVLVGAFFALHGAMGWQRAVLAAFDIASLLFLLLVAELLRKSGTEEMRDAARRNDANRVLLLVLTGAIMIVVMVAVAGELQGKNDAIAIALVLTTLVLAWLFSNTIYALHYAHLYYAGDEQGRDLGGLDFVGCDDPDYWDFCYFSFTLGMTFQTSDTQITSRRLRRIALGHSLAAFVFNLGVLAFTINTLGGGH